MRRFVSRCKRELILFLLSSCVWAGVGVSLAFILQYITETALNREARNLPIIAVTVGVYLLIDALFEFAMSHTMYQARAKIGMLLRKAVVSRVTSLSVEEKETFGDAHYLSLINNNVSEIETGYVDGVLMVIFQLFSLVFALAVTAYIQPILAVIAITLCVLPVFVPKILQNRLETVYRTALAEKSKYLNVVNELLQGFLTLKIFNRFAKYSRGMTRRIRRF